MTADAQRQATDPRLVLERNHAEIVAMLAAGATQPQIAQQFGVARSTVLRFVRRNQPEIDAKKHRVSLAVEDYAIAQKVNRIAALNDRWHRLRQIIEERAASDEFKDVPGMKTGTMVRSIKSVGGGEYMELVNEFKVDTGLLAEIRNIEHAAAEELAQLPKAPPAEVNVNVGVAVGLTWNDGRPA